MKFNVLLFAVLGLFMANCNPQTSKKQSKTQQQSFNEFLNIKKELEYRQGNDIQKKEFFKQFETDLFKYLDSVKVFTNWKGQIKDIKTKEFDKSTLLEFEIFYEPEKYREITFHCSYLVNNDSLNNNYLFNKVKNLSNYSTVYVDGFIKRKLDNTVSYYMENLFEEHISYPHYKFNVIEISKESKADTLSQILQNAIVVDFEVMDLFKENFKKKITQEERNKKLDSLKFDSVQSVLSEHEKIYSQRIRQFLLNDFMNE